MGVRRDRHVKSVVSAVVAVIDAIGTDGEESREVVATACAELRQRYRQSIQPRVMLVPPHIDPSRREDT